MKIVQIITRMDVIGGAQSHVQDLSIGLQKKGHMVTIISGGQENVYNSQAEKVQWMRSSYLQRDLHFWRDLKAFLEIRKKLKEIQPTIIATHSAKAGIIGRLAGWSLKVPTIFTAHGWSFTEGISRKKRWLYKHIERTIAFITNGIITVSEYDYQLAQQHRIACDEKIITIHNGVHDLPWTERIKHECPPLKIIMVARFEHPKRQLNLVKALEKIDHAKWQLLFAGDGSLRKEAEQYVERQQLQHQVQFLGDCDRVEELLEQSAIFILLSDWEGLPLSILEAMRSGLPVIATNVGGVSEAVHHKINGVLIPRNDEEQLITALLILLENQKYRTEMGKASRLLFEGNFTFQQMLLETMTFYDEVIQRQGKYAMDKGGAFR